MDCNYVQEAAEYVRARIGETPRIGLILGSGLGGIAEVIEGKHVIPYGEIPHFVCSTAPGPPRVSSWRAASAASRHLHAGPSPLL